MSNPPDNDPVTTRLSPGDGATTVLRSFLNPFLTLFNLTPFLQFNPYSPYNPFSQFNPYCLPIIIINPLFTSNPFFLHIFSN